MKKIIIISVSLIIVVLTTVSVIILYPYMQYSQYLYLNMEEAPILKHSWEDDAKLIKSLIDNGADVNAKGRNLDTPLHNALRSGSFSVAKVLIEAGAYVKAKNIDGETTLDMVCDVTSHERKGYNEEDQYELAKLLIEKGVEVNSPSGRGKNNPLIRAVGTGNIKLIKLLIENGADVNAPNHLGNPPIAYIPNKFYSNSSSLSSEKQLQTVKLLVENGANINIKSRNRTNLLYMLIENDPSVLKYLIDKGIEADLDIALFEAVRHNKYGAAKIFIENGANVNYKSSDGTSVLAQAIAFDNDQLINYLISKGAKTSIENNICSAEIVKMSSSEEPNVSKKLVELLEKDKSYNCEDKGKNNLLMHAVQGENLHLIDYLLKKRLDVNHKNKNGQTALMLTKDPYIAQLLIKYGAFVNAKDNEGKTPLMFSLNVDDLFDVRHNREKRGSITEVLLVNGASIEQKDKKGRTPLFHAAMLNSTFKSTMLLDYGANIKAKDNEGNTVLHIVNSAVESDFPMEYNGYSHDCSIYGLLIERGADVTAKNNKGIDINKKAREANCDLETAQKTYKDNLKSTTDNSINHNKEIERKISFVSNFIGGLGPYSFKYEDKRHVKLLESLYDNVLKANKDKFIKIKNYNYDVIFEKLQQLSNLDILKAKNIDFYSYMSKNNLDKAKQILQQKIKSTNNKGQLARYYSILADVEYLNLEHEKAYKNLQQAIKLSPKNRNYAEEIYKLCLRIEKYDDLNKHSNQIIKLINSEVDYNFDHFDKYFNKIYKNPKYSNYNETVKSYQSTIAEKKEQLLKNKTFLYPTENTSGKYLIQDLNCEEAIEKANSFWRMNEGSLSSDHHEISILYMDLARVYTEIKNYQTAIMLLNEGLKHSKIGLTNYARVELFYSTMAEVFIKANDHKNVVKYYKLAIDASTKYRGKEDLRTQGNYYDLGKYYYKRKQYDEALTIFKSVEYGPSHFIDYAYRHIVYILIKKIQSAIRINNYTKALKILDEANAYCDKDSEHYLREMLNTFYAEIAYKQKNFNRVIKYATKALEEINKLEDKNNEYNRFVIYKNLFYLFEAYKAKKDTKNTLLYFDKVEAARNKVDKDLDLNTHLSTCFKIE